jgi:hypothetical protein
MLGTTTASDPDASRRRRVHTLLTAQSVLLVLASFNRLAGATDSYVAPNQFLRWSDLINMLLLPMASVLATDLLRRTIRTDGPARGGPADAALGLTFTAGVYLFAAGFGAHGVSNYLRLRYCPQPTDQLCTILIFNDNQFSHLVFFAGFMLIASSVMLLPVLFPLPPAARWESIPLSINALVVGAAIVANLALETTGLDLAIVGILALVAAALWWSRRQEPLFAYYAVAWWSGLLATTAYKLAGQVL